MKKAYLLAILLCMCCLAHSQVGIGKWRSHFAYGKVHQVEVANERVYACGDLGLFFYDTEDQTVNKFTKVEGLSDIGISTIAYDKNTDFLVIAYTNSNIDLVKNDQVFNLSDIKRSEISGDKSINKIRFYNKKVYLACGFGVVVIDLNRKEISDVYYLGNEGSAIKINDIAFWNDTIIVASDSGLIATNANQRNLHIYTYWNHIAPTLDSTKISNIEIFNGNILLKIINSNSDTSILKSTDLQVFDTLLRGDIRSLKVSDDKLVVSKLTTVEIYDKNFNLQSSVGNVDWMTMKCLDATTAFSQLWIASEWAGLVSVDPQNPFLANGLTPSSPCYDDGYRFKATDNGLFLAHGSISGIYYLPAQLSFFQNNEWHSLNKNTILDSCYNIVDVSVDPTNKKKLFACSWANGVLEITNNSVSNIYNEKNTNNVLYPYISGDYRSLRIGATAVDKDKNIWFVNSLQNNSLVVRKNDGSWQSFVTNTSNNETTTLMIDSVYDYKWFICGNRLYIHDGENKLAFVNPNNGSKLETNKLNCIAQDQDNELWLGTDKGVKVIYSASTAFDNGGNGEASPITCNNILYSEDGNIEYLLAYEEITCITVDGANRKWIGTASGGVFLISANGTEQLQHFSSTNSPLPSDKIADIGIEPKSGEVFFATNKGIVSYRSTATYAENRSSDTIYAFPNPVKPDYDGPIAIKGFSRNALIHITDASGHVVFTTKSLGGQAIWNGRTSSGHRVASGVYYVFASDTNGENRSVAKVLILR